MTCALLGEPKNPAANDKDRATKDLEKKLNQQLGSAAQREDQQEDLLLQAAKGMKDAHERLAQGKSEAITQQVQRQAVADLQKIIDEATKSGKCLGQSMAGGRPSSSKPNSEPNQHPGTKSAAGRPAGESDPKAKHDPKPARSEREQIARKEMRDQYDKIKLQAHPHETTLELPSEYFLPEYEREIEDYFRRLSSGKPMEEK